MEAEMGRIPYGELVKQGIETMGYKSRPTPEDIRHEAQRMAAREVRYDGRTIYGTDAGAMADRRTQETNAIVRKRFEEVVQTDSAEALKGTLWASWSVEDCAALLQTVDTLKSYMKQEEAAPRFFASLYEDRLEGLVEFAEEHRSPDAVSEALVQLENLINILNDITANKPSSDYFRKQYEGWTDEQLHQFQTKAQELYDDLADYEENISSDY